MNIRIKHLTYEQAAAKQYPPHKMPRKPLFLLQAIIRLISIPALRGCKFSFTRSGMEKLGRKEPCLILMNHSSFIDLQIANRLFFPRRYGIVCTSDGFVGRGKRLLMRLLGCLPTRKFVSDLGLIRDMNYMLKKKKTSVLMFPEASYSFDGTATPLPRRLGLLLKKLDVPVVMVSTKGAFHRQPLYNNLQHRKVAVSAHVEYLLSKEEIQSRSVAELDAVLDNAFRYDHFAWQQENQITVSEPYRAEGLHRVLYLCPHCGAEGRMESHGDILSCKHCEKAYRLTEQGALEAVAGETAFTHIPTWYAWQRAKVRHALEEGSYRLETPVAIKMMTDFKAIYHVGAGKLIHEEGGFTLTGCGGQLHYTQNALASYGLYSDFYWYQQGDVICIGNQDALYYCFPTEGNNHLVTKARLAQEELYKLKRKRRAAESV